MKPVLFNKRRFTWKDILRIIAIFIGHYFFFALYVAIFLLIRFSWTQEFIPDINYKNWLIYYPVVLAPAISASLHILYSEKGSPWLRFTMWVHAMINIILVPVITLT